MVTKQNNHIKGKKGKVLIKFLMPPIDNCACLYLVGTFDEWNESVYRMQRTDDGKWSLMLEVDADHPCQYRYRTDKGDWYDDPDSNEYVPDRAGSNTAVVHA